MVRPEWEVRDEGGHTSSIGSVSEQADEGDQGEVVVSEEVVEVGSAEDGGSGGCARHGWSVGAKGRAHANHPMPSGATPQVQGCDGTLVVEAVEDPPSHEFAAHSTVRWRRRSYREDDASETFTLSSERAGLNRRLSSRKWSGDSEAAPEGFGFLFPEALDEYFREFDDRLIERIQWRTDGGVYLFSWLFTALTSIEASLPFPMILFALGYDVAGSSITMIIFMLTILSQLPKRFLWRTRPWVNGRAKKVRTDSTSSFPSRGVICGIVFPISAMYAIEQETGNKFSPLLFTVVAIISVICTSFARVNVGAHYPSDTIFGILLGAVVQAVGFWSLGVWDRLGSPSHPKSMYATDPGGFIIVGAIWSRLPLGRLIVSAVVSFAVTIITMRSFWLKCNYVYGLLLSSFTFRVVFLSASAFRAGTSLAPVPTQGLLVHLWASFWGLLLLGYGMLTRGKKGKWRIVNYLLLYSSSLSVMLWFRLN